VTASSSFKHLGAKIMMKITALAFSFFGFVAPALAVDFAPEPQGFTVFSTPSDNMCCLYSPDRGYDDRFQPTGEPVLTCDRVSPDYWKVILFAKSKAKLDKNPGEVPGCGNPNILQYGQSWSAGAFTCLSTTAGLKCTRGKNGFFMSRKRVKAY
jgi:hypothetical protein